jgi:hypothetical protein
MEGLASSMACYWPGEAVLLHVCEFWSDASVRVPLEQRGWSTGHCALQLLDKSTADDADAHERGRASRG